jgi:hypothetical protein
VIRVRVGRLEASAAEALLRPVAADGSAVTPSMRRLELAAGPELQAQWRRLGELPVGSAAITGAGDVQERLEQRLAERRRGRGWGPGAFPGRVRGWRRVRLGSPDGSRRNISSWARRP